VAWLTCSQLQASPSPGWRPTRPAVLAHTQQATKSSSLTVRTVQVEGSTLCDVACAITRPLVPLRTDPQFFHAVTCAAHPGVRATKHTVTAHFVWKGVGKDVTAMCCDCQQCQSGKVHKQPAAPLHAIPVPACRFSHVHVSVADP
jgi:hypothetical protein